MTLRVEISIVPFGDESKKYVIETLNISNLTGGETSHYVIEHNDYKNYTEETPRIMHKRSDGALDLVRRAIGRLQGR